jgi:hypothetical protein
VTNDVDTLATALYVKTDDLLIQAPHLAPWRPKVGIRPRLSDAELVTLAVMQALLGFTSLLSSRVVGLADLRRTVTPTGFMITSAYHLPSTALRHGI